MKFCLKLLTIRTHFKMEGIIWDKQEKWFAIGLTENWTEK